MDLLDKAKAKLGSDGATARFLGVNTSMIGHIRHGRAPMPVVMSTDDHASGVSA